MIELLQSVLYAGILSVGIALCLLGIVVVLRSIILLVESI